MIKYWQDIVHKSRTEGRRIRSHHSHSWNIPYRRNRSGTASRRYKSDLWPQACRSTVRWPCHTRNSSIQSDHNYMVHNPETKFIFFIINFIFCSLIFKAVIVFLNKSIYIKSKYHSLTDWHITISLKSLDQWPRNFVGMFPLPLRCSLRNISSIRHFDSRRRPII
jgi:hypothetical protein